MAKNAKHYFLDGKVHEGGTHKMQDGSIHSGARHTKNSKIVVHFKDLSPTAKKKARKRT